MNDYNRRLSPKGAKSLLLFRRSDTQRQTFSNSDRATGARMQERSSTYRWQRPRRVQTKTRRKLSAGHCAVASPQKGDFWHHAKEKANFSSTARFIHIHFIFVP